ncbi:hypothetical protein PR202_gb00557 [Eleusine coracana subsp. coracana]|uniref:AMP-dependent synthetase/ligase domain-containing protein n=1 Tax=Eleusine coracana subsp. coracana TaxID=191504 RepID=A0AAV5DUD5_ELECO|nr:hypothetical protein PR202_gb00557 [Eleusine coracana subsp. coracana]
MPCWRENSCCVFLQTLERLLNFIAQMTRVRLIVVVDGDDAKMPLAPVSPGVEIITYSSLLNQVRLQMINTKKKVVPTAGRFRTVRGLGRVSAAGLTPACAMRGDRGSNPGPVGYRQITNAVKESGGVKEKLFYTAYNAKRQAIAKGRNPSPVWDKLVFNKIKARLGGQVRLMSSGASPLSPNIMEFLRICFGCEVLEGYGMTETSCTISAMDIGDKLIGHVGSPNPSCEIKLVDVPEMSYTSEDQPYPRGEICVRGPMIFRGYYKDDVQTREILDEDGWLHTGDIGLWLPGGRLKIIDRKKNIFKLAQGEYIAPEKIENVYAKCNFIAQCFIYGDSLNSSLVAIIAVEPEVLKSWAASEGIQYEDLRQLCADPRTRAAVLADMDSIGKEAQLRGFEFAKAVTLVAEPFTMENGLLTPTFKVKRPQAKAYFAKQISDMYAQLQATESPRQKL